MQCYHVAGHELDLLESFVHDCIQQLPKLQAASDQHLPPRCSSYHTTCSSMLKEALLVLEQISPRLCRLVAQIWDLTSLNFFVLVQLAHAAIGENEQFHVKSRNAEHFHQEMLAQQTQRLQRHEVEIDKMRLDSQNLRAELQKTRQKQNRLAVENSQLRQAISGLIDTQDPLSEIAASGGGIIAKVDFEDDIAVVGDAEEREFYGVNGDELDKVEKIHPIESLSQDLELLFEGLANQERLQMATLNDLDRFMNSKSVSLLWQYGSSEEEHRLMQKMMNARTVGSQTDAIEPVDRRYTIVSSGGGNTDAGAPAAQGTDDDNDSTSGSVYASGETGNATLVTKRQTIPASLRAQLQTRPKIQRVLEKDQLNRIILRLYLEKLDADAAAVRARKPRVGLHAFMKQFFLARYGIASLADYHMMEVVKSCLFYHEHLEIEHRKIKALGLPTARLAGCYPHHDSSNQFSAPDIRVALFSRVCELVPPELAEVPVGGNLYSRLTNVLVDMIGDVVEMDDTANSLEHVFRLPSEDRWECSMELALALLSHHLIFAEKPVLEDACARISQLSKSLQKAHASGSARIAVDVFLAIFASTWLEHDQRLTRKLRDGFKRQLVTLSPFAAAAGAKQHPTGKAKAKHDHSDDAGENRSSDSNDSSTAHHLKLNAHLPLTEAPLESLLRICSTLPNESLSPLDLEELRATFEVIVEAKRELVDPGRGVRRKTSTSGKKASLAAPAAVCIGGVSEKEFVSTTMEILRKRRNCFGIRTHSRLLSTAPARMSQLGASRQLVALIVSHDHDADLPLEKLKPGLEPMSPPQRDESL